MNAKNIHRSPLKILPPIPQGAHKYVRGSLLVLASSKRYPGAGVLVTLAAEKAGAGYITLAAPTTAAQGARQHLLCSPVLEVPETQTQGSVTADALREICENVHRIDAFCCGPGLTVNDDTISCVGEVLQYCMHKGIPLLLDADGLSVLATNPSVLQGRKSSSEAAGATQEQSEPQSPLILTPHHGELKRLLATFGAATSGSAPVKSPSDSTAKQMQENIALLSNALDAVIVAKGPSTTIAYQETAITLSEATPALARAGTGDVLAGVISSLLAQGIPTLDAAYLGVRIHSKAGILAEEALGRRSVTALDVIEAIPRALQGFEAS